MFTQEYWENKARMIMEEYNPGLYRRLKKNKTLEERMANLGKMSLARAQSTYNYLLTHRLPQNRSLTEISTTEFENTTMAREIAESELVETIMSMNK